MSDMDSGIDLSALSWVQGEIDQSLTRGLESLAAFKQTPSDQSALQRARTHYRQAVGAIQMVGLDALAVYSLEIELQLDRLGTLPTEQVDAAFNSIERSTRKLQAFIAEIQRGAPLSPLMLFSEYEVMQKQRGVKESNPADLFFPDISRRIHDDGPQVAVDPKLFPIFLIRKRRLYQLGLLDWLRGNNDGIEKMRETAEDIQAVTPQRANRTFWWVVAALFDALQANAIPNTFSLKQLLARIDLQIRRLTEGSNSIAERLWREALYFIARSGHPATERVHNVQNLFHLSTLMPSVTHGDNALAIYRIIRELQKRVETLKAVWTRVIAGQTNLLPAFKEELAFTQREAAVSPYAEMNDVFAALDQGVEYLEAKNTVTEAVAMEYATVLLFAEDVFAQYGNPVAGLAQQVQMLRERVQMALSGQTPPSLNVPRLEEMTRKAEDKALLTQLVRDIQGSLRHMEQELDIFFRDHQKRDGLTGLAKDGQDISGALRLLGHEKANRLLQACMTQIASYTKPETELTHQDFELLAESLSALGFYAESLEQSTPKESLILPLLTRYRDRDGTPPDEPSPPPTGTPPKSAPEDGGVYQDDATLRSEVSDETSDGASAPSIALQAEEAITEQVAAESAEPEVVAQEEIASETAAPDEKPVEVSIGDRINTLRHLGQQLRMNPHDQSLAEMIATSVQMLAADVNLMSDAALAEKIKAIKEALRPGDEDRLAHLLGRLAEASPAQQPSEETQRLLNIDASDLDNELLEIYLTEAMEVLDGVHDNRQLLASSPSDVELLRNVRRAFHTLKGSGRMVGLTDLGELAFDVEKIHNKLLEIGYPATPIVLKMMETAENEFRGWVLALINEKTVSPSPEALHAAIAAVENEISGGTPSPSTPPPHPTEPVTRSVESTESTTDAIETLPPLAAAKQEAEPTTEQPTLLTEIAAETEIVSVASLSETIAADAMTPEVSAETPLAFDHQDDGLISLEVIGKAPSVTDETRAHISVIHPEVEETAEALSSAAVTEGSSAVVRRQKRQEDHHEPFRVRDSDSGKKIVEKPLIEESLSATGSDFRLEIPLRKKAAKPIPILTSALDDENHIMFEVPLILSDVETQAVTSAPPAPLPPQEDVRQFDFSHDGDSIRFEMFAPLKPRKLDVELRGTSDEIEALTPLHSAAPLLSEPVGESDSEAETVRIGGIVLTRPLFDLFINEAEQHWSTLNRQMTLMRLDTAHVPDNEMVRAAHTLASIHSTTGFFQVFEIAKALELLLLAIQERARIGMSPSLRVIPVIARAVAGLRVLIDRIVAKEIFAMAEEREVEAIIKEIKQLQKQEFALPEEAAVDAEESIVRDDQRTLREEKRPSAPPPVIDKPSVVSAPLIQEEDKAAPPIVESTKAKKQETETTSDDFDFRAFLSKTMPPSTARAPEVSDEHEVMLSVQDEIDAQLLPLFLDEAKDLVTDAREVFRRWKKDVGNQDLLLKLKRALHTFKGSARMVGAMRLGELAHQMENRLEEEKPNDALFLALTEGFDHADYVLERLSLGETDIKMPWLEEYDETQEGETQAVPVVESSILPQDTQGTALAAAAPVRAPTKKPKTAAEDALLRVPSSHIDQLVNETGEIIITRTRAEGELRELKGDMLELTNSVIRLRQNVRVIEIEAESQIQAQLEQMQEVYGDFDPLEFDRYTKLQEMTRSLAEGVNDVATVQQAMLGHLDTVNQALFSQSKIARDVQQSLFNIRTVPFASVTERLYRIQRSLTKELQKRANLEIRGGQHELDRAVLERLIVPLEHLLRNALDHGVEAPEIRRQAGKPERGEITIEVHQAGSEIVVALSDDGSGLNVEKMREKAKSKGIDSDKLDEVQLFNLIFEPGFSTAKAVTAVSGRGIGLDIVQSEITALGGRIEVSSESGKGTRFTIYLPLTVAVAQTVLLRGTQNRIWAVPTAMVEQVEHVSEETLAAMYRSGETIYRGERYPFFYFDRLVDRADTLPEMTRYNPVIFLHTGQGRVAIHVDQILGNQEVVVKSAGTHQVRRVSGLSGATILGTGEIVLIVNPVQLAQREHIPPIAMQPLVSQRRQAKETVSAPLVLIVDDSLTIRKVTSRLMLREGYAAEMAKDGFDALKMLAERRPDIILLDIEMPRMDGFEFAKLVKSDPDFKVIPIIMITSRTADKHRERALELGVGAYLGKPYQEEELLGQIEKLLGEKAKFAHSHSD